MCLSDFNDSLIFRLGPGITSIADSFNLAPIRTIIANGSWHTNNSNHVLAIELRQLLSAMPISSKDQVLWNGDDNPNISSMWHSVRVPGTAPLWQPAIWHSFAIPKCSLFMWLALKKRLLTKDKMLQFGFNVNPTCILCHSCVENAEHIFSDCPFTYLILKSSPVPISLLWTDLQMGIFTVGYVSNLKKHLAWLYISVTIYSVWWERNTRIHQSGKINNVDQMIYLAKRMVREKVFTIKAVQKQIQRDPTLSCCLY